MGKLKTTEEFIRDARCVHGDKYDYDNVDYRGRDVKVKIICPEHGEFEQRPANHLHGKGCPECGRILCDIKRSLGADGFIKKSREVHGDKYDYSKVVYTNNTSKVKIICPIHGEFTQLAENHMAGRGCPKCGNAKKGISQRKSHEEFINEAKAVHGDRYDYSCTVYTAASEKVKIICPIHGEFFQTPAAHLRGAGCPVCGGHMKKTTEEFIRRARKIHGELYDYSAVNYENNKTKVQIGCPIHGDFLQSPIIHLDGSGCPVCGPSKSHETKKANGSYSQSIEENSVYGKLCQIFGKNDVARQYREKRYPFACDFYIKSLDLFIEYNGFWTHGGHWYDENSKEDAEKLELWRNKNTKFYDNAIEIWTKRDVLKRSIARRNNIGYVALWKDKDVDKWLSEGCPIRQDWK